MSNAKKTQFLIDKTKLSTCFEVLSVLTKTKQGYVTTEIDTAISEFKKQRHAFVPELISFTSDRMEKELVQFRKQNRLNVTQQLPIQWRFLKRRLHENLAALFAHENLVFYHKYSVDKESNRIATVPCKVECNAAQVAFSVVKEGANYVLKTFYMVGTTCFSADEIERKEFLLFTEKTIYLLDYQSYLDVERVSAINWATVNGNEVHAFFKLITELGKRYLLNREALLTEVVESIPENAVYVSELDQLLLIHPRWYYDGIEVSGNFTERLERTFKQQLVTIIRHKESEENFVAQLRTLHPNFSAQNPPFYLSFAEAKKKDWFLKQYQAFVQEGTNVIGMDFLRVFRFSDLKPTTDIVELEAVKNTLTWRIEVRFGEEKIALHTIQQLLNAKQNTILLKNTSLAVLTNEWINDYGKIVQFGKIEQDTIRFSKSIVYSDSLTGKKTVLDNDELEAVKELLVRWQDSTEALIPLPASIHATLKPYQVKGYEWLVILDKLNCGVCLADDMGLGKTLQTIAYLSHKKELDETFNVLVVCPASLIFNWSAEIAKFASNLSTVVFYGKDREAAVTNSAASITITSYTTFLQSIDTLNTLSFDVAVFDESHNVKNLNALTTKAAFSLNVDRKICISGTPIINDTLDLYAQLSLANSGMLGTPTFFKSYFANPISREGNKQRSEELKQLIHPFILRRTKEQIASDLPEKTINVLYCKLHEQQQVIYNELLNESAPNLRSSIEANGIQQSKMLILTLIQRLRQVCDAPSLLNEVSDSSSIKADVLLEQLTSNLAQNKVLVFSQFIGMLDLLEERLKEASIPFLRIDGSVKATNRQQLVDEFQTDPSIRVFLLSLKAANTGLTLTAADYVFLVDPWWNEAIEQQAIDRTHRIGQTKPVFAYKLICKDTIEEKILKLQSHKRELRDQLIVEDENFIKTLTLEDIDFLFEQLTN